MKKHQYKIIISFILIILSLSLFPAVFCLVTAFIAGAFAHSSDRDRQKLQNQDLLQANQ